VTVSFWLEDAGDDLTPRPALQGGPVTVDLAIVGAGYTGLWTAREVLRRDPSRTVLVLEARIAGFGASGRNGAWLSSGLAVTPTELARRTSPGTVRETVAAMRDTVDTVIASCAEDGIDARVRKGGVLRIARGRHEAPALASTLATMERLGIAEGIEVLSAEQLGARIRVQDAWGAVFDPNAAAIHPGRLVRGLARTVEALGGAIVEDTHVTEVHPGDVRNRARLVTDRGEVHADAVVIAGEAWVPQLPGRGRDLLPLYSLIVLTEPVDDEVWARIGWQGHELLSSHRYTVDYLSRTTDGRVLFGGRGAPYHFGSRIRPAYDQHEPTHALLRDQLASWFPDLAGIGFSHRWGGPLGMPRDWMPNFHYDPRSRVGGAYGYTGQGVATSNLAGRILADLIVHGETPFADLPMVGHRSRRWEPEPLRWLGARYLQVALTRIDAHSARTGEAPTGRRLSERLLRH
jgi:glycine/D-amino acid oxidase-like deaminating enzyme